MAANQRVDDVGKEDLNNSLPIKGVWDNHPPLTFEKAVERANVPGLDETDVVLCKDHFVSVEDPPAGLTVDEASAVRFYTMETPFYGAFNLALRSRDRNSAKAFFPFLQLLLLGIYKLPKSSGTLFRGTKNLPASVLDEYRNKSKTKKCVFWGACSSTTTNVSTLQNPMFCGKEGNRTQFVIQNCPLGASVESVSAIGVEKEVLLPPCVRLVVEDFVDMGHGLVQFQLTYSAPPMATLQHVPPPHFLPQHLQQQQQQQQLGAQMSGLSLGQQSPPQQPYQQRPQQHPQQPYAQQPYAQQPYAQQSPQRYPPQQYPQGYPPQQQQQQQQQRQQLQQQVQTQKFIFTKKRKNQQLQSKHMGGRTQMSLAKSPFPMLSDANLLQFWNLWFKSIPPKNKLKKGSAIEFIIETSATMEKVRWRTDGPQNLFIQDMVDFFHGVGGPAKEIDRLNELGEKINPAKISCWIDMSAKGGMDGGWFFHGDIPMTKALQVTDRGTPSQKVSEWARKYHLERCFTVGRDMGAEPPHQTEIRLCLPGPSFDTQFRVAEDAFAMFGFPAIPQSSMDALREWQPSGLCLSVTTSPKDFVQIGLMVPSSSLEHVMKFCVLFNGKTENLARLEGILQSPGQKEGPVFVELRHLKAGFGYGVYKEGFDVVLHYGAGGEWK